MYNEESIIMVKSRSFALRITNMVDYLQRTKGKMYSSIYNQVLRSGTSIMANVGESQFAQSRADFITKLHIALKEANETKNWLYLLHGRSCLSKKEYESINDDCKEIVALLVSSLNTAKKNAIMNNKM